jgi:prepilin-type processing-associated H-X9-DG protein
MKPRISSQRKQALAIVDVLVIVAVLGLLAVMLFPFLFANRGCRLKFGCVSNLKQINLSFRIWEGDNNNQYPMAVSTNYGGAMEPTATGDVVTCFRCMSNELSTPRILCCPEDSARTPTRSFGLGLNDSNISYFVSVDANESYPQRIMSGDNNLLVNGSLVKSGLLKYPTNTPIAWTPDRHDDPYQIPYLGIPLGHHYCGNIGYADGSVAELSSAGLQAAFVQSDLATNHLAIP